MLNNVDVHQDLHDLIADHSLIQIVDKPTRNDKTLDLIITNYPSIVDNLQKKSHPLVKQITTACL